MTTPQELAYYLQGFFEITDAKVLTPDQVQKIKNKVASCFEKKTSYSAPPRFEKLRGQVDTIPDFKYKSPMEEISVC